MKLNVKHLSKHVFFTLLSAVIICTPLSALSMQGAIQKEEIVYGVLQTSGECEAIYIVNHFPRTPPFIDYGEYEWIRNLTNTSSLALQNESIQISTHDPDFYYEGKTKTNVLPWLISFAYTINGKPVSPSDLGGRNGKLNFTINIEPSKYPNTFFHEKYALQVIVTLHSETCENIHAPGATIISVGKEKQLTYTILPGSHWTGTITTDVNNFSLKPIMIHGMQLTVPLEMKQLPISSDVSRFQDSIRDLQKGSVLLSSGANDLVQGARDFSTASKNIQTSSQDFQVGFHLIADGIFEMQNNIDLLQNHSLDLQNGSSQILNSLQRIDQQLQEISLQRVDLEILVEASLKMQDGIKELSENTKKIANRIQYSYYREQIRNQGLDIEDLVQWNTDAISQIEEQIQDLTSIYEELKQKPGFYDIAQKIAQQIHQLKDVKILLEGNNAVHNGTQVFFEESSSSLEKLNNGMKSLQDNYIEFHHGIQQMVHTLLDVCNDVADLTRGVHNLATSYEAVDHGIKDISVTFTQMSQGCYSISQGAMELLDKTKELTTGTTLLVSSSSDLAKSTISMKKGSSDLKTGLSSLNEETMDLDERVQKQINDVMESITREVIRPPSFVSKKNGTIQSVQFHFRTHEISAPKPVQIHSKENRAKNFWEKLLDLFRIQ